MNAQSSDELDTRPRIVVGVDGSESSVGALREGARMAAALRLPIHAVSVWHYPLGYANYAPLDWSPTKECHDILDRAVREAFGDTPPDGLSTLAVEGPVARTLIDLARGADMLVVGSRGHGGFAGMVMGSVSSVCAAYAKCPVLIFHAEKDDKR